MIRTPTPPVSRAASGSHRFLRRMPWWALPAVLWICFALLAWQVLAHGPVTVLDVTVRNQVQRWAREPSLRWTRPLGHGLADIGDQPAAYSVTLLAALAALAARIPWRSCWSWRSPEIWRLRRSWVVWQPLLTAFGAGLGLLTVIPLKIWIGRPGPMQHTLGRGEFGFFPSGHTSDSVMCYGAAALILCRSLLTTRRARFIAVGAAVALVLLTIPGLLWSNYHWLSDTIGAVCWCGGVLCLLARILRQRSKVEPNPANSPGRGAKMSTDNRA